MENDEKVDQLIKESIPIIVCGGNVEVNGILDCTGHYRKDLSGWPDSQRTHRRIVSSPSVAVAVADVFSKSYHSIPNKIDKILKIFDRLDNVKSQGVIFYT